MRKLKVVHPGEGEMVGVGAIKLRIIEDGSNTEHRLGLAEFTVPPGPALPPQHFHKKHDEVFIITQGTIRFTSGLEVFDAPTGSVVVAPPNVPHTFHNPFGEPAKFLSTFTPDLYIQYFRDLAKLPVDDRGLLSPSDIGCVMAQYDTHVVGPSPTG